MKKGTKEKGFITRVKHFIYFKRINNIFAACVWYIPWVGTSWSVSAAVSVLALSVLGRPATEMAPKFLVPILKRRETIHNPVRHLMYCKESMFAVCGRNVPVQSSSMIFGESDERRKESRRSSHPTKRPSRDRRRRRQQ